MIRTYAADSRMVGKAMDIMTPKSSSATTAIGLAREGEADAREQAAKPRPRTRVLFFACSAADAQTVLKHGNEIGIAFLPSSDMDEINNEIARFMPRLIMCRVDFFLAAISSSLVPNTTRIGYKIAVTLPNGVPVAPASPRDTKVLSMLTQGKSNREIALALNLSVRTVKRTLSNLFERFGVSNRTELSNRTRYLQQSMRSSGR